MAREFDIFSNPIYDFEFLGFSFNERHSSEFGLTVVSGGGQTQDNIFASFQDKTVEVSGREGAYYFGTEIKTKSFSIQLAYDRLTSYNYREILAWLNPKLGPKKLIFDERPYKYYMAKIESQPSFSYVPFEEQFEGEKIHVFKGELTVSFIAYDPYAYCDTSLLRNISIFNFENPQDKNYKPYIYGTIPGWFLESGLFDVERQDKILAGNTSFSNPTIGIIKNGIYEADFYNCGNVDSYPYFEFIINEFPAASPPLQIIFETAGESTITLTQAQSIIEINIPEFSRPKYTLFVYLNDVLLNYVTDYFISLDNLTIEHPTGTWPMGSVFKFEIGKSCDFYSLKNINESFIGPWTIVCDPSKGIITTTINSIKYNVASIHNGEFIKFSPGSNKLRINKDLINLSITFKNKYW